MPLDLPPQPLFSSWQGIADFNSYLFIDERLGTITYGKPFQPIGSLPFSLNNTVLDFVAPFSVLNEPNGVFSAFSYLLVSYQFGGTSRVAFVGSSLDNEGAIQVDPFSPVPLPASFPLMAAGLAIIALLARRPKLVRL
jgi:hypothetical protein